MNNDYNIFITPMSQISKFLFLSFFFKLTQQTFPTYREIHLVKTGVYAVELKTKELVENKIPNYPICLIKA